MVDHSLRFYVSPEALKNEDVMRQVESWPWVEVGQEGDKSFLQIGHNHLADLPQEFIPVGLPALFRKIGTGKVSLKSIYRKPYEGLKDGLYTVGTVKVSRLGFYFMMVGDNYLAVIRAFKMVTSGRMNLVIDQSDAVLRKQIGKLQAANNQLRSDNRTWELTCKTAVGDLQTARANNKDLRDLQARTKKTVTDLSRQIVWLSKPFWKRWAKQFQVWYLNRWHKLPVGERDVYTYVG